MRLRLILNGAYLDEDIQSGGLLNEEWFLTKGYDTSAIVMSSDDQVTKPTTKASSSTASTSLSHRSTGATRRWFRTVSG